jgi:hypothetical protein
MKPERIKKHCSSCGKQTIKGKGLEFISSIIRDGSGTVDVSNSDMSHLDNTSFSLNSLSITNKTYIASEFNSYVVKLKNN